MYHTLRVRFLNSRLVTLFPEHLNVCAIFRCLRVTAKPLARTSNMNKKMVRTQISTITGDTEITETQE